MCGRFSQARELKEILKRFQAELAEEIEVKPRYNIPPSQDVLVIYTDESGHSKLRRMKWDIARSWAKVPKGKPLSILRAETVLQRGFYNKFLQKNRCLIPVDGFNEWKNKMPFRFVPVIGDFIGLGGVYNKKILPDGKVEYYFALITTEPNALVSRVHDRQPIVISPEKEALWLNPAARQYNYVDCLGPSPAGELKYYPVSPLLNIAKNDFPALIEPVGEIVSYPTAEKNMLKE